MTSRLICIHSDSGVFEAFAGTSAFLYMYIWILPGAVAESVEHRLPVRKVGRSNAS